MQRRDFLSLLALAGIVTPLRAKKDLRQKRRPNVLIIQPDQHSGMAMGCAGNKQVKTPNLDQLAEESIHFTRSVSASPVCSPFRGTFQTGLYPHKHGVTRNGILLDPALTCFAEVFTQAGYATGYIGKWHLDGLKLQTQGGEGLTPNKVGGFVVPQRRQGWQEWNGYEKSHEFFEVWKYDTKGNKVRVKGYDWEPTWHTDMALDFIKRKKTTGKPWLYYIAYGPPHDPEQCLDKFLNMYDPNQFIFPPGIKEKLVPEIDTIIRKSLQMYYGQVSAIDHEVGRLIKALKEMGEAEHTIIVYTSDHGDKIMNPWPKAVKVSELVKRRKKKGIEKLSKRESSFRGKASPHKASFMIPLIIKWPGEIKDGIKCDALVSSVDLLPTILELAGITPIKGMQGDSMASWCLNQKGPDNKAVWIGLDKWSAVWDGRYLYARGPKYNLMYDHVTDPYELNDLMKSSKYKKEKQKMHENLLALAKRVEYPKLAELEKLLYD